MLSVTAPMLSQISTNTNWYDGSLTYTASHLEHNNVLMNASAEGEELEFILRYSLEVNANEQVYTIADSNNDCMNPFEVGTTARHIKSEGWDVICFYDSNNSLKAVMSSETQWNSEKINKARWTNQLLGRYATADGNTTVEWSAEHLNVGGVLVPYSIETFNGGITGYITVGQQGTILDGMWEVEPTLNGLRLHEVSNTEGYFYERERGTFSIELNESDPMMGRFFYASSTLLNDKQFRRFDKATLRFMRNAILARHGWVFQSQDLQNYFNNEPWYKPAASNDDIHLSFIEQLNIDLIKNVESEE